MGIGLGEYTSGMSEEQLAGVSRQIDAFKDSADAALDAAKDVKDPDDLDAPDSTWTSPRRAVGGSLRWLHHQIGVHDTTIGDLRRVRKPDGSYLWVYKTFEAQYQSVAAPM